jgi:hypothetical protein
VNEVQKPCNSEGRELITDIGSSPKPPSLLSLVPLIGVEYFFSLAVF